MRKLLSLFLALAASVGTMWAWDYEKVQIGDLYYSLDATNKTAEVTGYQKEIKTAFIPIVVEYKSLTYRVTGIGDEAFRFCSSITSVTIPNSIISIGDQAFRSCDGLTTLNIPNSVTMIPADLCCNCSNLTSITIPNSVTLIGEYAFGFCDALTTVTLGKKVATIKDYAFTYCKNLRYMRYKSAERPVCEGHVFLGCMTNYTWEKIDAIPTYTVTFLDWNGTELSKETVEEGDGAIGPATDPTREGYYFTGWDKTIGNVTEDITATAQYAGHNYTVTFLDWDKTELHKEVVAYGKDAKGPETDPTREGFTFIGWDKSLKNITKDITVTAQYEQHAFTVTFLDWNGTELYKETVEKGEDAKGPETEPYREGYNFTGWNKPITNVKADLTVTAQYEKATDEVYSVIESDGKTQTLYYNKERSKLSGKTDWSEYKESITTVVLHESMRNARPTSLTNWFRDFSALTEIKNLDYLNVSEVEKMDFMFYNCSSLTTIECNNDWYKNSVSFASSSYMFTGCTKLVGGNGTVYNPSEVSRFYAHPDKPGNPGYFTAHEEVIENTALTGRFTVNSEGKQVIFSKGNLQYKPSSALFQFAANQYTIIGERNKNIAANYDGWIDLFGWGTGNNPTKKGTDNSSYSVFTDWGTNPVFNGGEYDWRTLTMDEWDYIINQRSAAKRGPAVIADICGYVLLPDEWEQPGGIVFDPYTKTIEDNTYTAEQWQKMEEAGAVFLPCAGMRSDKESNTTVNNANKVGIYWSSTPYTEDPSKENYAQSVYIMGQYIIDNINVYSNGLSVRLVRDYFVHTVTFVDWDGTELFTEKVAAGEDAKGPDTDPTREGYTFNGWDKSLNNVTEDMTVTAQYTVNTYKVTLVAEHGAIRVEPEGLDLELVEYGTVLTLTAVPDEGYEFDEWTGYDGTELVVTGDVTVTATFKEIVYHTVTFMDWNGDLLLVEKVEHGKDAKGPATNPTREGWTFTGWSKPLTNITSDLIAIAQYAINTYTVIFQDYDGMELKKETVEWGKSATAPSDPTREGYTFTGWKSSLTSAVMTADEVNAASVTAAVDYTAQYESAVVWYTVTFLDWDGTFLFSEKVEEGHDAKGTEVTPTREGYTFTGWSKPITNITADLTVIALYEQNPPTGVENTEYRIQNTDKILRDGRLYIIVGDRIYDATGKKVQ